MLLGPRRAARRRPQDARESYELGGAFIPGEEPMEKKAVPADRATEYY